MSQTKQNARPSTSDVEPRKLILTNLVNKTSPGFCNVTTVRDRGEIYKSTSRAFSTSSAAMTDFD